MNQVWRRGWGLGWLWALALTGCAKERPLVPLPYQQDFSGGELPAEFYSRSGTWMVLNDQLFNDGAYNVPLWLSASLPHDVRVSFTAESQSDAVDIKFEIFGDGLHHESGYVVIFSGWNNSKSIIARLDEHGRERSTAEMAALEREYQADPKRVRAAHLRSRAVVSRPHRGEPNTRYAFQLERRGEELSFFVNGQLHLRYFDPAPLSGEGHDRFAFNNWASRVWFDNLRIEPL